MSFINNFKIFVFCALSLVAYIQARSISYSQIGDIRIELTDDKWLCDKIECPADTYRCYVSKSNEKDPAVLVRTDICYSKDNKPLAEDVTSTPIDANSNIRVEINSFRNGVTTTSNSFSNGNSSDPDFDEEKFQKDLQDQLQGLDSNLKDMNNKIQENLQNEMNHLKETLNNMQNNLSHMFG